MVCQEHQHAAKGLIKVTELSHFKQNTTTFKNSKMYKYPEVECTTTRIKQATCLDKSSVTMNYICVQ